MSCSGREIVNIEHLFRIRYLQFYRDIIYSRPADSIILLPQFPLPRRAALCTRVCIESALAACVCASGCCVCSSGCCVCASGVQQISTSCLCLCLRLLCLRLRLLCLCLRCAARCTRGCSGRTRSVCVLATSPAAAHCCHQATVIPYHWSLTTRSG